MAKHKDAIQNCARCGTTRAAHRRFSQRGTLRTRGACRRCEAKATALRTDAHPHPAEYRVWRLMRERCSNKNQKCFDFYGGRGIRVCKRWASFDKFFADMGARPSPSHQLDRIDGEKDYGPKNCRWVTPRQQARNRRNNTMLEFKGERLLLVEWSERLGIKRSTLSMRLKKGWSVEKVLTTPVRGK